MRRETFGLIMIIKTRIKTYDCLNKYQINAIIWHDPRRWQYRQLCLEVCHFDKQQFSPTCRTSFAQESCCWHRNPFMKVFSAANWVCSRSCLTSQLQSLQWCRSSVDSNERVLFPLTIKRDNSRCNFLRRYFL